MKSIRLSIEELDFIDTKTKCSVVITDQCCILHNRVAIFLVHYFLTLMVW